MPKNSIAEFPQQWTAEASVNNAIARALLHADTDPAGSLELLQNVDLEGICSPTKILHRAAARKVKTYLPPRCAA